MCWSATASLVALILGTVCSLLSAYLGARQKKWEIVALSIGWLWVIGMQYWEYVIWTSAPTSSTNEWASRWAYIFNVSQVLVLGILFSALFGHRVPVQNRILAILVMVMYTCYILYYAPTLSSFRTTVASCTEPHLHYPWWDGMPYGGLVYILSLIALFLLIVRPLAWSLGTLTVVLAFLAMSSVFYSSSVASMWCFFAVFVPILSLLFA